MRKSILTIACCVLLAAVASYLTHPILDSFVTNEEHFWETQQEQDERVKKLQQEFDSHLKPVKDMIREGLVDQTTLRLSSLKVRLDGRQAIDIPANCTKDECFDFYYFIGENFDTNNSKRKTILYMSGGPGQILTFDDRLERLEKEHNVVYFHLRGAGLSAIPPANKYDKYLRADHAIEDLEKFRLTLLESRPASLKHWDAIYGYSYGTTLAQRYAKKYPSNVGRLVLSAPIFRTDVTDRARSDQLRANLKKIYSLIRSKESVTCSCRVTTSHALKIKVDGQIGPGDDFCYMRAASDEKLIDGVVGLIGDEHDKLISKFGTLGFIVENLEQIKKIEPLDYPDEFYFALRKLTMLGAPQSEQSSLSSGEVDQFVDPAITLAYYISLERADLEKERSDNFSKCSVGAPLFRNAPEESCKIDVYCPRLSDAKRRLKKPETRAEPPRALYAFWTL